MARTPSSRWRQIERLRRRHIRRAEASLRDAFARQIRAGLYEVSQGTPDDWRQRLTEGLRRGQAEVDRSLQAIWQGVAEDFAEREYRIVKKLVGKAVDPPGWIQRLLRRVVDIFGIRSTLIGSEMMSWAVDVITKSDVLQIALNEGWGIDKMVRAFEDEIDEFPRYRIERIARTEVIGASNWATNAGAQEASDELGLELVKEWIATNDARTRDMIDDEFDHRAMDTKKVLMDQPFMVPSRSGREPLMFPGDPAGSAGNIINCRCTIAYIPADEVPLDELQR